MFLTSTLLRRVPGLIHGFGTRAEPFPSVVDRALWDAEKPQWKQVHGIAIADVRSCRQECGEVDGLFSFAANVPIAVVSADCVPLLLARKDGRAVAAVHSGWRGTHAKIAEALIVRLQARGEEPGNWVAAIGPSIGPCCYEVSSELERSFLERFQDHPREAVVPRHRHLNLPEISRRELLRLGVKEIETVGGCTKCTLKDGSPAFHSYRREGGGTRQWSVIQVGV